MPLSVNWGQNQFKQHWHTAATSLAYVAFCIDFPFHQFLPGTWQKVLSLSAFKVFSPINNFNSTHVCRVIIGSLLQMSQSWASNSKYVDFICNLSTVEWHLYQFNDLFPPGFELHLDLHNYRRSGCRFVERWTFQIQGDPLLVLHQSLLQRKRKLAHAAKARVLLPIPNWILIINAALSFYLCSSRVI